jgi:hypothetical protein
VLNDDYVFITWGIGIYQRMPLADWRIIIGDEPVREEYLPLPAIAEVPEPPEPIGTKRVWRIDDADALPFSNYCVAIQTKDGVLQVKNSSWTPEVTPYLVDVKRQMFPTYKAWAATLRPHGTVTKTLPEDMLSGLQLRKKRSIEVLAERFETEGYSASAIKQLQELWGVKTYIFWSWTIAQRISHTEAEIARLQGSLQRENSTPSERRRNKRNLEICVNDLKQLKVAAQVTAQAPPPQEPYIRTYNYRQRLYIHTSEGKLEIAYDALTNSIAVKLPDIIRMCGYKLIFVKNLLDLPFNIGPQLHLSVLYRRKEIDLYR